MQKILQSEISRYIKKNQRHRWRQNLVRILAGVVAFCTINALILPAITMEKLQCGLDEHTHSESCYKKIVEEPAVSLECTYESLGIHKHAEVCYDQENNLLCSLIDYVVHEHNDDCADENGSLVCQLPEILEHAHTEECYRIPEAAAAHVHEAACYTNLSQDHLDYFGTMERYFEAKKSFFMHGAVQNAALNADEETSESIRSDIKSSYLTFGISAKADVFARDIEISENGVSFQISLHGMETMPISMHLTGMFNVYNALAAASLAMIMGIDKEAIREGLESVQNVPGRVEVLDTHTPYKVILDYAHSPDALENVLKTVRAFTRSRLIALVGCGGDRDKGKRPMMGEIVGRMADFSILTSDNPRSEDPMTILAAVEDGMKRTDGEYVVIENRREAIRYALEMGCEGDVIILAGKGNETYQEIMGVKYPFDEKVVVQELLDEMQA